ncbi:ubiquitin fusion degradation protein 1-like protein [Pyrus ussuriensis x Pyrus communis]|uniref:Ubiquitin fusion degradation protein 1-like protein n=1 Tax=Pyrus ussuriensis x Pyrus communis TaxID=2448454 RepID=A0A5N5HVN8_9ROSA|nr:ubiquitin fusion degradation protein 1-like protein [Pyrus ussuriensis x Pyrus communis]
MGTWHTRCVKAKWSWSTVSSSTVLDDGSEALAIPTEKEVNNNKLMEFNVLFEEDPADAEPKFNPFTGSGRRLDGKPLKYKPAPASSSGSKDKKPAVTNGNAQPSTGSSSQATSCQARGKLVFGSNASRSPKETKKGSCKRD